MYGVTATGSWRDTSDAVRMLALSTGPPRVFKDVALFEDQISSASYGIFGGPYDNVSGLSGGVMHFTGSYNSAGVIAMWESNVRSNVCPYPGVVWRWQAGHFNYTSSA